MKREQLNLYGVRMKLTDGAYWYEEVVATSKDEAKRKAPTTPRCYGHDVASIEFAKVIEVNV